MIEALFSSDAFINSIIVIALIAGTVFLLYGIIKYKHNQPILVVILCIAWLAVGIYAGLTCYKYYSTHSYSRGEPEIHQPYEDFDFYHYELKDIAWYPTEDGKYMYETTYDASLRFEGDTNKFQLLVNNTPCTETTSTNGRLHGTWVKQFKNIDGEITDIFHFDIDFEFYSSEIHLQIVVDADSENIGEIREYVQINNGLDLRIIESVYVSD